MGRYDDSLFNRLADAYSRPSGAYRAASAALDVPNQGIEGYLRGVEAAETIRSAREGRKRLAEVLGVNTPPGLDDMTLNEADRLVRPTMAFAALQRAQAQAAPPQVADGAMSDAEKEAARNERQRRMLEAQAARHAATLAMQKKRLASQQKGKQEKVQRANLLELDRSKGIIRTIDDSLNKVGPLTTGVAGSVLQHVPQTSAKNLQQTLTTVKANVGFEELQRMRQSSPTGGALGQVSDAENRLLQATRGSLDQTQSQDQIVKNLAEMRKHYVNVILAIEGQTGDEEADDAIAQVIASEASENEKRARIQGIRAAAGVGQ